jgi:hypothetical protein
VVNQSLLSLRQTVADSARKDESPRKRTGENALYVVERTLSWFGNFRRITLCYEKNGSHFQAFHELAAAILCANRLTPHKARF